jgi:hypothetical protein
MLAALDARNPLIVNQNRPGRERVREFGQSRGQEGGERRSRPVGRKLSTRATRRKTLPNVRENDERRRLSLSASCANQRVGGNSATQTSSPGQTLFVSALFLAIDVKDFGRADLRIPSPFRSPAGASDALRNRSYPTGGPLRSLFLSRALCVERHADWCASGCQNEANSMIYTSLRILPQ